MFKSVFKKKPKKSIVAVLDVGSTKIVCLIAHLKPNGKIKIMGVGHCESSGFKSGVITDRKLAETSIITAVETAERMCEENIDRIIVSVSSSGLRSFHIKSKLQLPGNIITERDVNNLIKHTLDKFDVNKYEIIHYFPLAFSLDKVNDIKNPVGLFGYELTVTLHIVTLPVPLVFNLINCLADCHLDVEEIVSSSYASGFACLTDDEKELGVTLIDLGGATSSYAVFAKGMLVHSGVVSLGGMNITGDIAKTLSISMKNAERIKTLYGSAIITFADNYKMIDIPLIGEEGEGKEICSISNANLNSIIAARIEEIFEITYQSIYKEKIDKSYFDRVVLTGGTSALTGIKELGINYFKNKIRVAKSKSLDGLSNTDDLTTFSPAIGVLQYTLEKLEKNSNLSKTQKLDGKNSIARHIMSWVKENL